MSFVVVIVVEEEAVITCWHVDASMCQHCQASVSWRRGLSRSWRVDGLQLLYVLVMNWSAALLGVSNLPAMCWTFWDVRHILVDVSTFTSCVTLPHLGSVPLFVYPPPAQDEALSWFLLAKAEALYLNPFQPKPCQPKGVAECGNCTNSHYFFFRQARDPPPSPWLPNRDIFYFRNVFGGRNAILPLYFR